VDDSQLSLAIGKKGQNVRLAAKLLGWHIDIKSEEEKRQEIESQMAAMALRGAPISELAGLGDKTLSKLREHGIESVEQLGQMTPEDLMQIPGVGEKTVERIRRVVTDYFERDQSGAAAPPAEIPPEAEEGEVAGSAEAAATAAPSTPAEATGSPQTEAPEEVPDEPPQAAEAEAPPAEHVEQPKAAEAETEESSGQSEPKTPGAPESPEAGGEEK
jgi:N utilization substance protein A